MRKGYSSVCGMLCADTCRGAPIEALHEPMRAHEHGAVPCPETAVHVPLRDSDPQKTHAVFGDMQSCSMSQNACSRSICCGFVNRLRKVDIDFPPRPAPPPGSMVAPKTRRSASPDLVLSKGVPPGTRQSVFSCCCAGLFSAEHKLCTCTPLYG